MERHLRKKRIEQWLRAHSRRMQEMEVNYEGHKSQQSAIVLQLLRQRLSMPTFLLWEIISFTLGLSGSSVKDHLARSRVVWICSLAVRKDVKSICNVHRMFAVNVVLVTSRIMSSRAQNLKFIIWYTFLVLFLFCLCLWAVYTNEGKWNVKL